MSQAFHGTPITPNRALHILGARNYCVSFYRPDQIAALAALAACVMIDNGAFSAWRKGLVLDAAYWARFYGFVQLWLPRCAAGSWFVIPDVIDAGTQEQDALMRECPAELLPHAAPVWHMDEPISRLLRLCEQFPRVCMGSTAEFRVIGSGAWRWRMDEAWDAMASTFGVLPAIHMLRGMQCFLPSFDYPFASGDSTDLARNHNRLRIRRLPKRIRFDEPLLVEVQRITELRHTEDRWAWSLRQRADRWEAMAACNPTGWLPRGERQRRLAL